MAKKIGEVQTGDVLVTTIDRMFEAFDAHGEEIYLRFAAGTKVHVVATFQGTSSDDAPWSGAVVEPWGSPEYSAVIGLDYLVNTKGD